MKTISLEELLEAGCHFGHQVTRQNPKAREFVFEARDNIHIIDLAKTKEGLEEAAVFVKSVAAKNGTMIILGTKKQAEPVVKEAVKRATEAGAAGLYSVTYRWIGGTLTNIGEMMKNYKKLKDLEMRLKSDEAKEGYTKREVMLWERELQKLRVFYGGIADMKRMPDAIFIVDTHTEDLAVREARNTGVKTVGMVDTNADPEVIDYAIPANDDAVGSIQLIVDYITDAWIEGTELAKQASALADSTESDKGGKELAKQTAEKATQDAAKQVTDAASAATKKPEEATPIAKPEAKPKTEKTAIKETKVSKKKEAEVAEAAESIDQTSEKEVEMEKDVKAATTVTVEPKVKKTTKKAKTV